MTGSGPGPVVPDALLLGAGVIELLTAPENGERDERALLARGEGVGVDEGGEDVVGDGLGSRPIHRRLPRLGRVG